MLTHLSWSPQTYITFTKHASFAYVFLKVCHEQNLIIPDYWEYKKYIIVGLVCTINDLLHCKGL